MARATGSGPPQMASRSNSLEKSQAADVVFQFDAVQSRASSRLHTYMGTKAVSQRLTRASGRKSRPPTYPGDRAIELRWQRRMARATHRVELDSDHSSFLCMPEAVPEIFTRS